jgi:Toprim domain
MGIASELSRLLAQRAEAVCRAYLPKGRRSGHYWIAGDVRGERGKSLYIKLSGERAGRWTDAATVQHGDLLDLIRLNKELRDCREAIAEARKFPGEPGGFHDPAHGQSHPAAFQDGSRSARMLYALSQPVPGTLAEIYLRGRGITAHLGWPSLRFHPACYHHPRDDGERQSWPALLGAVTDAKGSITGLQRTYLAPDGGGKAPFDEPRRAMGLLLGNAVRFGEPEVVMAAGEGIETVLSLLSLFPALPMAAALSAAHLSAFLFPAALRRLYLLRDNDAAGLFVERRLAARCREVGIACLVLRPAAKDLNIDLRQMPPAELKARMLAQMEAEDRSRFGE